MIHGIGGGGHLPSGSTYYIALALVLFLVHRIGGAGHHPGGSTSYIALALVPFRCRAFGSWSPSQWLYLL